MNGGFLAGSIVGKMVLDRSKWSQSAQSVEQDTQRMGGMSSQTSAKFQKMGAAMTVAGGLIVASIGGMIKKYVNLGDEIDKMSKRTGFSATKLSELAYAADISGASLADVEKGVKRMSKTITDASEGMATYQRAFKRIGITAEELKGMGVEEQFFKIAEGIAAIEDPTLKAATAQDIFGRAGTKLLPLFDEGEKGMAALSAEAHKLGIIFDQEAAAKAAKLKDAQTALKGAFTGLGMTLAEHLVPVLTSFVQKITDVVAKISAWAKAHPGLFSALTKIAAVLGTVLAALGPMLIILPKLVAGFGMLKTAVIAATGPVGLLIGALGALAIGYMKVKAAQDAYKKSAAAAAEAEDNLFEKLKKAADQAGLSEKEFLKLRDAYDGNAAAMAMAIKRGKEGEELQKALAKVGKEHREEVEKQKTAYDKVVPSVEDYTKAIEDVTKKSQTWTEFLKDLSIKTIPEKEARVKNLEKILRTLNKAYDDGVISLEDYTAAVAAAKSEMVDLVPPTLVPDTQDMAGVLGDVQKELSQVSYWSTLSGEKLQQEFALASNISVTELQNKIYQLSSAMMSFAGVTMPDVVISSAAAWPQLQQHAENVRSKWAEVTDGIRTKWTNELSAVLEGTTSFRDALSGIWDTIKQQFFDMVAGMISKWTFGLIEGVLSGGGGLIDALTSPFKGAASTLTGSESGTGEGGLFGNMGGSFLSSIAKMAGPIGLGLLAAKFLDLEKIGAAVSDTLCSAFEAIGGVITGIGNIASSVLGAGANIISGIGNLVSGLSSAVGALGRLFGAGGKKYGEITYWLDLLWIEARNTYNATQHIASQTDVMKDVHLAAINQSTQKVEEIMDGRMTLWVGNIAKRTKKIVEALTKKGSVYVNMFKSAVIDELRVELSKKLTTLEKMNVVKERLERIDKRTADRTKRLEQRLVTAEGEERERLQQKIMELHDRAQQRRQKLIERMKRLEERAAKEAKQQEQINTTKTEAERTRASFGEKVIQLGDGIGVDLAGIKGELRAMDFDTSDIVSAIDGLGKITEKSFNKISGAIGGISLEPVVITKEIEPADTEKIKGKKKKKAQYGAIITGPTLVEAHGTPSSPEVFTPASMFERMLKKEIKVDITNQINLTGTIITDREYARQRIIPELIEAIDSNADHIKRRLKAHLGI